MLAVRKTRPREALALMWCAGQLPDKNLAQGLRGLSSLVRWLMYKICLKHLAGNSVQNFQNFPLWQKALISVKNFP